MCLAYCCFYWIIVAYRYKSLGDNALSSSIKRHNRTASVIQGVDTVTRIIAIDWWFAIDSTGSSMDATPAELAYATILKVPAEFLVDSERANINSESVQRYRNAMRKLRSTNTAHHSSPKTFESAELRTATHVSMWNDSMRPSLSHPYDAPVRITKRSLRALTSKFKVTKGNTLPAKWIIGRVIKV